ncbi:hypothetical protein HHI36_003041, partial [Cryptolaemus montrouzieri]
IYRRVKVVRFIIDDILINPLLSWEISDLLLDFLSNRGTLIKLCVMNRALAYFGPANE